MIKRIQLYAERHTGSNWLTSMLSNAYEIDNPWDIGWKHWFPDWDKIEQTDTSDYLFILLVRNPYQWVSAMCEQPHHAHPRLKGVDMVDFITQEWECQWDKRDTPWVTGENDLTEMMHERNPDTGERFKNVMELRNFKNREFLKLKDKVEHFVVIKYEDLLESPSKVINSLSEEFPINLIKNTKPRAKNDKPRRLTKDIRDMINVDIDWSIERELGYKKNMMK